MTAPRRELFLHLGLPKTGTTYLQKCLALNRDWFAAQGFAMGPLQNANGAHHELAWRFRDEGPEAFAETLRRAPGDRLIVSSEVFDDLLLEPGTAETLARALAPDFAAVAIAVLRRQDLLKESAYAEVAKLHRRMGPLRAEPDPALAGRPSVFDDPDLDARLAALEAAFGPGAVRVAVYRDDRRRDPLEQFCGLLGLAPPAAPRRPEGRANESLPRRKTQLLAPFDKSDPRLARAVFDAVSRNRRIAVDAPKFLLSPAERRAVAARHLEGNRRLVARHAPEDGDWLLTLPPDEPDWFPAAPPRLAEYLRIWAALMRATLRDRGRGLGARLRDARALTAMTAAAARDALAPARRRPA